MRESKFEKDFIKQLETVFPGCVVMKNPSAQRQGVPDRLLLWQDKWAMLEFKSHSTAPVQPNQPYYIELFDSMSFAAFVYPENSGDVLDALQRTFSS